MPNTKTNKVNIHIDLNEVISFFDLNSTYWGSNELERLDLIGFISNDDYPHVTELPSDAEFDFTLIMSFDSNKINFNNSMPYILFQKSDIEKKEANWDKVFKIEDHLLKNGYTIRLSLMEKELVSDKITYQGQLQTLPNEEKLANASNIVYMKYTIVFDFQTIDENGRKVTRYCRIDPLIKSRSTRKVS